MIHDPWKLNSSNPYRHRVTLRSSSDSVSPFSPIQQRHFCLPKQPKLQAHAQNFTVHTSCSCKSSLKLMSLNPSTTRSHRIESDKILRCCSFSLWRLEISKKRVMISTIRTLKAPSRWSASEDVSQYLFFIAYMTINWYAVLKNAPTERERASLKCWTHR